MKKYLLPILTTALCLNATSAFAQKGKGLVKGLTQALSSRTPSAVSEQVERQVARNALGAQLEKQVAQQIAAHHPALGWYVHSVATPSHLSPVTPFTAPDTKHIQARLVQTAPILNPFDANQVSQNFTDFLNLTPADLTQAFYMWRLANPQSTNWQEEVPNYFLGMARYLESQSYKGVPLEQVKELPNLQFLKRLKNPAFTPVSYAELYENLSNKAERIYKNLSEFPKYIYLDKFGVPFKSFEADEAALIDNYLMLSNPQEMGVFNNGGDYTPFILTETEHIAADKLLDLRIKSEKLPPQPNARDLLSLAYNRLAAQTVPYTEIDKVGPGYKAYPNYKNTELYQAIKKKLDKLISLEKSTPLSYYQESTKDNLLVLNAIMGGMNIEDLEEASRVLNAFEAMCKRPFTRNKESLAHFVILQRNLAIVFEPLIQKHTQKSVFHWGEKQIYRKAWYLLTQASVANELVFAVPVSR